MLLLFFRATQVPQEVEEPVHLTHTRGGGEERRMLRLKIINQLDSLFPFASQGTPFEVPVAPKDEN